MCIIHCIIESCFFSIFIKFSPGGGDLVEEAGDPIGPAEEVETAEEPDWEDLSFWKILLYCLNIFPNPTSLLSCSVEICSHVELDTFLGR